MINHCISPITLCLTGLIVIVANSSFVTAGTSDVIAGPVWQESAEGDAGSKPDESQETDGVGQLSRIQGETEGNTALLGTPDFEDMYTIRICDPDAFIASTVIADSGFANFNTQLFLFRPGVLPENGIGLLANNDTAVPPTLRSRLLPDPTDGSPSLTMPGVYYLAIAGFPNRPQNNGEAIFFFATPTEISGPDGNGGNGPLTEWSGPPAASGNYEIHLGGVTFATGTVTFDCNGNNVHDACDIAFGSSVDVNGNGIPDECENDPDLDDDDDVDLVDLLILLSFWGPCSPPCPADLDQDGTVGTRDMLLLLGAWSDSGRVQA